MHVDTGVNLCDEASAIEYFAKLPGLWACLNLAGGFAAKPIAETTLDDFRRMIDMKGRPGSRRGLAFAPERGEPCAPSLTLSRSVGRRASRVWMCLGRATVSGGRATGS